MTDKIKLKADKFVNDKKLKLNYFKSKDLKILLAEFCEEQIAELKARIEKMKADVKQEQSYWNSCDMQYSLYQRLLDKWEIK